MASTLDSGVKLVRNVGRFNIGPGSLKELTTLLSKIRQDACSNGKSSNIIFLIDSYFENLRSVINSLNCESSDLVEFVSTASEPTTEDIDALVSKVIQLGFTAPAAIVGMGGGVTMDTAKALANLLTNPGKASDYQGWDLVKNPGIFKVGIPTISGTGSEATRTCVMTNASSGLKLGMNSDFTVFDHIIMDSNLTATVPRDQYFFTGMDSYIHCIESLAGNYRNPIGDAYSRECISLCRQVFLEGDMQSPENRERLMVASYFGGCAIATSYVGLIHPLSAALSVVFGIHHCIGNCIVMNAVSDHYPYECEEFKKMAQTQKVTVPTGICQNASKEVFSALYAATVMHEKPLTNALGEDYKKILTLEYVADLFKKM